MALGSLRVLKNRNYALMWCSGLVSNAGTWMQTVAVGALITSLTHKAGWAGLIAAASYFTSGLSMPFGGVVADRHDRRRLLIVSSGLSAAAAFLLATLYSTGHVNSWVLLANVSVEGVLTSLYVPAMTAMMPDLVDPSELADAAAVGNASWNLGRTLGPALGGAVIAFGSYGTVFVINAISCLFVALAMLLIRMTPVMHDIPGTVWERLRDGFSGARADEGCWSAVKTIALVALLVSPFIALIPAMAQLVFHGTAIDTSHLVIAQGVGSVVGAIFLSPLATRLGRNRMVVLALVGMPLAEMAYSQAPTKNLAIVGAFAMGAFYVGITVGLSVVIQLRVAAQLRARVLALQFTTLSLFYPVGAAVQGWIGDQAGIRNVQFWAPACFLGLLAVIAAARPAWLRSLDGPPTEPAVASDVEVVS